MKRKINQIEAIEILKKLDKKNLERGINFVDFNPSIGFSSPNVVSAGKNLEPKDLIEYIQNKFSESKGKYITKANAKNQVEISRIDLTRTDDNSSGYISIQFYKKLN